MASCWRRTSGDFTAILHAYEWTYLVGTVVLAPGPIHAAAPTWGVHGNWYRSRPGNSARPLIEARPRGITRCTPPRALYRLQDPFLLYPLPMIIPVP